ncbi:hypothetical protein RFI_07105 [Reticulomyxa filosa]|uniref:Uncharacterized protein n=1 Tax=Reticulomyxa filosa TaxID=46433 RepID=X6NW12_RETFI|nr:hypothetical protein RFI_07105 [Reticulomyxa filosa]|eukprot:ETO30014.1 hypothetical protein RFI_07105 [Reticulomyxa filosa]
MGTFEKIFYAKTKTNKMFQRGYTGKAHHKNYKKKEHTKTSLYKFKKKAFSYVMFQVHKQMASKAGFAKPKDNTIVEELTQSSMRAIVNTSANKNNRNSFFRYLFKSFWSWPFDIITFSFAIFFFLTTKCFVYSNQKYVYEKKKGQKKKNKKIYFFNFVNMIRQKTEQSDIPKQLNEYRQ